MKKRKTGILVTLIVMLFMLCLPIQASAYTGFKKSSNGTIKYYDNSGKVVKNKWFKVKNKSYYAKEDGVLATSLTKIGDKYYYFDSKGMNKTGWVTIKNKKYYFVSGSKAAATGFYKFKSGKTYCFNSKGMQLTGWRKSGDNYYYFKPNMKTGWITLSNKKYYLIKSNERKGQRATGVFSIGGKLYYFDPDTGVLQKKGTVEYNDRTYYVNNDGTCTVSPDTGAPSADMLFFLKFESGSQAYNQTGGDHGCACGAYQFDYRYSLLPFVKYAYKTNKKVCAEFKTYASYTNKNKLYNNTKFYSAWKKIYKRNKKTFARIQDTYARINYYDNVERSLERAGIDISARSDVVKGAVFSYSIQHGQSSAISAVKAIKAKSSMSDKTFLKKLYNYRKSNFPAFASRYNQEYQLALKTLG